MPKQEDVLKERTYKGQYDEDEIGRRVYSTLGDGDTSHRTRKLMALLVEHLVKNGSLDEAKLDEMLLGLLG